MASAASLCVDAARGSRYAHPFARCALTALLLTACSSVSYIRLGALEPPGTVAEPRITTGPTRPDKGRVFIDVAHGHASVVAERDGAEHRLVCASTPCIDEAAPGTYRYRFIPIVESRLAVQNGLVVSKDGIYDAPVEASAEVMVGQTQILRANLGRTEVRRSLPVGRGIGWTLFAAGLTVVILGVVNGSSAPRGSGDEEVGQGLAEIGLGTLTLGGALLLSNLRDNVTVSEQPGSVRQWLAP